MAKTKNKKGKSSEDVHNRKQTAKKVLNPFEVHINREKMKVLGKKTKNSKGLPGISRAKGIQKRKETILQEYKLRNKNNHFKDKRLGEKNTLMSEEDRVIARFAAVRAKAHKKSIFNLADDEILTHKGKALTTIDKFHDPRSDDEESLNGDSGQLSSKFVEDAHFAGGIFTKSHSDGAKTHKEVIDELIAESKKRKAEKQQVKEATLKLTEELDAEWKDLMPLITKSASKKDETQKPKVDDYDKLTRQLKFEPKGRVTDRLKSEDEIAKEEKEKLEELEKERLQRMKGIYEEKSSKPTHKSADDLDDDFQFDTDLNEDMLTYNEQGESNVKIHAQLNGKEINLDENSEDEDENVKASDEESCDDNDDDDCNVSEAEEESETEDNLSDLKGETDSDESISQENEKENTKVTTKTKTKSEIKQQKIQEVTIPKEDITDEQNKSNSIFKTDMMEKARNDLPYTFTLPGSYEELESTLDNHSVEEISVILERMIKCNHPSLSEGNKQKLGALFTFILQYLNDIATNGEDSESINLCFKTFAALAPYLFDLSQFDKGNAHKCVREVIKEKQEEYRKKPKSYPGLDSLVLLKLVSLLFPTSDFRHQVVTPCCVYIDQMLTRCKVNNRRDISYGLFLTTLVLEYTSLSKRYLPSAINFLNGLIHMAIPKVTVRIIKVLPPFHALAKDLVLLSKQSHDDDSLKMIASDLLSTDIDDDYKVRVLYNAVKLLSEFHTNFKELPSNVEIFEPTLYYLELLPQENYPDRVKDEINSLIASLNKSKSERKLLYIAPENKRPKALRLFEPKIEEVYDGKRHKVQSEEKAEREKLLHKFKKERKGALREIRKDQAFLSRVKVKEAIERDQERREKVKRIYAEASIQQSELNALDRAKKKKK